MAKWTEEAIRAFEPKYTIAKGSVARKNWNPAFKLALLEYMEELGTRDSLLLTDLKINVPLYNYWRSKSAYAIPRARINMSQKQLHSLPTSIAVLLSLLKLYTKSTRWYYEDDTVCSINIVSVDLTEDATAVIGISDEDTSILLEHTYATEQEAKDASVQHTQQLRLQKLKDAYEAKKREILGSEA